MVVEGRRGPIYLADGSATCMRSFCVGTASICSKKLSRRVTLVSELQIPTDKGLVLL
jgi:hypothetical protein